PQQLVDPDCSRLAGAGFHRVAERGDVGLEPAAGPFVKPQGDSPWVDHASTPYPRVQVNSITMQVKNLRYSRLKTCATPSGYPRPLKLGNHQANSQKSPGAKRIEAILDAISEGRSESDVPEPVRCNAWFGDVISS